MQEAVKFNEFGRLGEIIVMTKPPLRLVLDAKTDMPRSLNSQGLASFIIGSARMFSGDVELCDPQDRKLAEKLFLYGDWTTDGPFAIMNGNEITGVEFIARPEEPSDQGFDGIGWASRIFGRYFAAQTTEGKEVIQLNGSPAPEWFAPLATWPFETSKLPLWLGRIESPPMDELSAQ